MMALLSISCSSPVMAVFWAHHICLPLMSQKAASDVMKMEIFMWINFPTFQIQNYFVCSFINDCEFPYNDIQIKGRYSHIFIFTLAAWYTKNDVSWNFPLLQYYLGIPYNNIVDVSCANPTCMQEKKKHSNLLIDEWFYLFNYISITNGGKSTNIILQRCWILATGEGIWWGKTEIKIIKCFLFQVEL